ncbi:uncharacterized protein CTHT_0020980 [Thermochaetoides thermophila DSM 1495]|uniref:SnoaL-like domain-containing protein n=1 Tax=Chaetomium thermophilum (strain DSM 1495 / CBS 144.50 / IMI 039719) TaxID=759272 RepID=G0S3G7_CHATD|nr:hypothetical protein CTHT_0020980 [Thermochaetoides thermophila DSM 1495]EGS22550.1 hypothetical protein CTHT_0020980 [Thermochaetoides thermophila DSM 1495]
MYLLSALAAAILAPITGLAAPAGDVMTAPPLHNLYARENLCHLPSPPQLCTPNASVTIEETALRAYKFYRAFVVDGDPRTMFSYIDNVYLSGPQVIWPLFCNGRKIGTEESTSWCFDASTNMSYAQYSVVDRWRWVDGCVHEHWDQGERMPPKEQCYQLPPELLNS